MKPKEIKKTDLKLMDEVEDIKDYADRKAEIIFESTTRQIDNLKRDVAIINKNIHETLDIYEKQIDILEQIQRSQHEYINNIVEMFTEYNKIQNEQIDNLSKGHIKNLIGLILLAVGILIYLAK